MCRIKSFKWLIAFVTVSFIINTSIYPTIAYAGGLKFGIISVVKDKIDELKEKKREKIAKETARIRHFEGETNAQGTASYTLPDGKNILCYVYDEEIENLPISGVKVYLITDGEGSKGAYFIVDPQGEYCPQIVNALEYGESQGISRSEAEYQAQFIALGKKIWLTFKKGRLGGNAPDPLPSDVIDQELLDYICKHFFMYVYSCTLYDLMPYSSFWDFLKSQLAQHGAEFAVTGLLALAGVTISAPVSIALAGVELAIFGQDAYWYNYYKSRSFTDQDWFDLYQQKIPTGTIPMFIFYPRKSIPPSESKGAIGGKIIDSSGNPIRGVFVRLIPSSGIAKTGLTGLFYFEDIPIGTYEVRASREGYEANCLEDVNPGETDLVITLFPANQIPIISGLSAPSSVSANASSLITCNASDPDGDPLTYTWSCNGGSISGSGYQVTWNAPGIEGTCQVKVIVSDPDGRKAIKTGDIYVSTGNGVLTNVALNKATTASGVWYDDPISGEDDLPEKAVDGNMNTRWNNDGFNNPTTSWWQVDLEQSYEVEKIIIRWYGISATNFKVQYWDGDSWEIIIDFDTGTTAPTMYSGDAGINTFEFSPISTDKVRFYSDSLYTDNSWNNTITFWEFEVYADVSDVGNTDTYEPNDSFAEAYGLLTWGQQYESYIYSEDDRDYYKINVTSEGKIEAVLRSLPSYDTYGLMLYDPNQVGMGVNVQVGGDWTRITTLNNVTTTGTYYILVYGKNGAYSNSRPYLLETNFIQNDFSDD